MQLVHTVADMRAALHAQIEAAFVPTMGNLHAGHVSLVELAKQHGHPVVASVFVNPLQFGPDEDFARYPRTLDADCEKLAAAGCDLVFAPEMTELYPTPQTFTVQPPQSFADDLCGAFRPGHFTGVATVVLKLFNLIQPRTAVFGRKDYQQLLLVRELVQQFNLPITIMAGDTTRESDGLAMSSRNSFLSASERIQAVALYRQLAAIADAIIQGEPDYEQLVVRAKKQLKMAGWHVDYIAVRDADNLQAAQANTCRLVVLGAAWLDKTRLIDNIAFSLP
ncbi:MAG: pantoate--beta-alanine ligase [Thiobacillus sp.]